MAFKMKVEVGSELEKKLEGTKIRAAMLKSMKTTMMELNREIIKKTPVGKPPKGTGNLRRSNNYEVHTQGNTLEGIQTNSANYWQYVNFGTSKMAARPFIQQAASKVKPREKIVEHFWENYNGGG